WGWMHGAVVSDVQEPEWVLGQYGDEGGVVPVGDAFVVVYGGAWRTGAASTSTRWGAQPAWSAKDGTSTATKGYNSSCADGWVSVSVKNILQYSFTNHQGTANVGLRASSETNHDGWKKFKSSEASSGTPYIELTYNRTPNVPNAQKISPCFSACVSPALVSSPTPKLFAVVSDPDGGTLRAEFEVFDAGRTVLKAKSGTSVTGRASGTEAPWTVTVNLPDAQYHWRVRACDSYVCGGYSAWFTFTVDTTSPTLPLVTSTDYPSKDTGAWSGGVNIPGMFTFGPNAAIDVQQYTYTLNGGNAVTVPAGQPQVEQLTANQRQVSTDLTGFAVPTTTTMIRDTTRGHDSSDSLKLTPVASSTLTPGDTFAGIGATQNCLCAGMQPGKRYVITGWIYVPAATGLTPVYTDRGLRIVGFYATSAGYTEIASPKATITDGWQQLSLIMAVPASATQAFVRLYNGMDYGSGKAVYWDDLSLREVTGTTSTVSIAPPKDGVNTMLVQSVNGAGIASEWKPYEFLVRPNGALNWYWPLDDNAATGPTPSLLNTNRPLSFSTTGAHRDDEVVKVGTGAVTFNGSGSLSSTSPVLDTSHPAGFTIAAWVYPTNLDSGGPQAVVAQDGTAQSVFELQFRDDIDITGDGVGDPQWCFTVHDSDTATAATTSACTSDFVAANEWTHLTGVYDPAAMKIKLYVNGTVNLDGAQAEASVSGMWSATGRFAVGGSLSSGAGRGFIGTVDEVYASQRVWSNTEIDNKVIQ
ncbi:LamG-like jellyroll fold domain-containing protein, partial [Rhizomonospora bruguierae]|uniref:LamG-like jellyroll fold domain-containing protein n=1 Tax=Rhizomonospora bruguierae TaxID=1581705 RepID=UPI00272EE268